MFSRVRFAAVLLVVAGCQDGRVPHKLQTAAATGGGGGTTTPGTTAPVVSTTGGLFPSSAAWMTEDEEVAWINSLGFKTTVQELRASYSKFVPTPVNPNLSVLWDTETDDLRNWYRLYKRTGHAPFLTQAQSWRDFYVNTYSRWQNGGSNVVEPSHVYLMGLIDWYGDRKDQETLDAIDRIVDFILQKVSANPFYETRVTARSLLCLAYYMEKIGTRASEVNPKIQALLDGLNGATVANGFISMKYFVGTGRQVEGLPAGQDLRTLFPGNTQAKIVTGQNSFDLKGFHGAVLPQDCILFHALRVAARVRKEPALEAKALAVAAAWLPLCGRPFYDASGSYNTLVAYTIVSTAPELGMFRFPNNSSPIYGTNYAPFCPDATLRRELSQLALLRQWSELGRVQPTELGGKPRYFPWQEFEAGYFLTQK